MANQELIFRGGLALVADVAFMLCKTGALVTQEARKGLQSDCVGDQQGAHVLQMMCVGHQRSA